MGPGRGPGRPAQHIAYFGWNFAEGSSQEDIFTVDPRNGQIRRVIDDRSSPEFVSDRDPAWSPDRRTLAIHRGSDSLPEPMLFLIHPKSGKTLRTLVPGVCPEWYDDRTLLFLRHGSRTDPTGDVTAYWVDVHAVDVDTLQTWQVTDLEAVNGEAGTLSWHPTAGLAFGYAETDTTTGTVTTTQVVVAPSARVTAALGGGPPLTRADLTTAITDAGDPDWSPDGTRIAHVYLTRIPHPDPSQCDPPGSCTLTVGDVAVRDLASGTTVALTADGPNGVPYGEEFGGQGPAFSPDGTRVAFTKGYEDSWQEIWLVPAAGGTPVRLTDEGRRWFKGGLDW